MERLKVQSREMQDEWIGLGVNAVKLPGSRVSHL